MMQENGEVNRVLSLYCHFDSGLIGPNRDKTFVFKILGAYPCVLRMGAPRRTGFTCAYPCLYDSEQKTKVQAPLKTGQEHDQNWDLLKVFKAGGLHENASGGELSSSK